MDEKITLELSKDEALVLFDWIKRFNEKGNNKFEDQAEERVLWDIEAILEKNLVIPFEKNYSELLRTARKRIRDNE